MSFRSGVLGLAALMLFGCRDGSVELAAVPAAAPQGSIRLVAGGDVMFGRWAHGEHVALDEAAEALGSLRPLFEPATFAVVNLETGLCDAIPDAIAEPPGGASRRVLLTAAPAVATRALTDAGVDVAIVANNHALDCGPDRFPETVDALEDAGVRAAGVLSGETAGPVAHDVLTDEAGARLHLLSVTERLVPGWRASLAVRPAVVLEHPRLRTALLDAIASVVEREPDALIAVSLHWGGELTAQPQPAQRALAEALVEAGAMVVLGHHPHVVQPFEVHDDAVIAYSLGNLVFDMREPETGPTGLLDLEIATGERGRPRVVRVEWHARRREGAGFVALDDDAWLDDLAERSAAWGRAPTRVDTGLRWTLD